MAASNVYINHVKGGTVAVRVVGANAHINLTSLANPNTDVETVTHLFIDSIMHSGNTTIIRGANSTNGGGETIAILTGDNGEYGFSERGIQQIEGASGNLNIVVGGSNDTVYVKATKKSKTFRIYKTTVATRIPRKIE